MMVSPVSAVNFRGTTAGVSPLEREGAYSRPSTEAPVSAPEKKSGKGKKILKTVGALALVAAALVGLRKFGVTEVLDSAALKEAGIMKKVGHYVGVAGEAIAKYTIDPLMKLFKGKSPMDKLADEIASEIA